MRSHRRRKRLCRQAVTVPRFRRAKSPSTTQCGNKDHCARPRCSARAGPRHAGEVLSWPSALTTASAALALSLGSPAAVPPANLSEPYRDPGARPSRRLDSRMASIRLSIHGSARLVASSSRTISSWADESSPRRGSTSITESAPYWGIGNSCGGPVPVVTSFTIRNGSAGATKPSHWVDPGCGGFRSRHLGPVRSRPASQRRARPGGPARHGAKPNLRRRTRCWP